jgi:hypothetical protein
MLSDEMMQLLTGYVDGELTPRQRDEAMRLLNKSAEAREVLRQLQENAHKLKQLKKQKVEPSLVDEIVMAIEEQKAQRRTPSAPKRRRSAAPYFVVAMAASFLFIAIGIFGWLANDYFEGRKDPTPPLVNVDRKQEKQDQKQGPDPIETPRKTHPLLAKITESTFHDYGAPLPPPRILNASFADVRPGGKKEQEFIHEVRLEKSVQLDVFVKKNSEAMARLRTVLAEQKIKLVVDPAAAKAVDDKKVEYLVYADNLTTLQLAKLMNELGNSYVVPNGPNNQKTVATPYQRLKLSAFDEEEKEKLATKIGVSANSLNRKEGKADEVKQAVVLLPGTSTGKQSKEVRQFFNERRDLPVGAVQVLIRIRQE